jgi:hypothetical protein
MTQSGLVRRQQHLHYRRLQALGNPAIDQTPPGRRGKDDGGWVKDIGAKGSRHCGEKLLLQDLYPQGRGLPPQAGEERDSGLRTMGVDHVDAPGGEERDCGERTKGVGLTMSTSKDHASAEKNFRSSTSTPRRRGTGLR